MTFTRNQLIRYEMKISFYVLLTEQLVKIAFSFQNIVNYDKAILVNCSACLCTCKSCLTYIVLTGQTD